MALNLSFTVSVPPIAAIVHCHHSSASSTVGIGMGLKQVRQTRGEKGKGPPTLVVMAKDSKVGSSSGKYKGTQMREKQLTEMIEKKVMEAKEVCGEDESSDECKVAWDEVEEVSQAKADLRLKLEIMHQDPLESFCQENPETDECRLYED